MIRSLPRLAHRMKPAERFSPQVQGDQLADRMPVAYSSSSMAWSRYPLASTHRGCSRNSSTSLLVRISGYFRSARSALMLLAGLAFTARGEQKVVKRLDGGQEPGHRAADLPRPAIQLM